MPAVINGLTFRSSLSRPLGKCAGSRRLRGHCLMFGTQYCRCLGEAISVGIQAPWPDSSLRYSSHSFRSRMHHTQTCHELHQPAHPAPRPADSRAGTSVRAARRPPPHLYDAGGFTPHQPDQCLGLAGLALAAASEVSKAHADHGAAAVRFPGCRGDFLMHLRLGLSRWSFRPLVALLGFLLGRLPIGLRFVLRIIVLTG
jgi:hypothetical protein